MCSCWNLIPKTPERSSWAPVWKYTGGSKLFRNIIKKLRVFVSDLQGIECGWERFKSHNGYITRILATTAGFLMLRCIDEVIHGKYYASAEFDLIYILFCEAIFLWWNYFYFWFYAMVKFSEKQNFWDCINEINHCLPNPHTVKLISYNIAKFICWFKSNQFT